MSTVPISSLYDQLRLHAKRCAVPAMNLSLRRAARQFCLQTKFRRESIGVNLEVSTAFYPLTPANADEEVLFLEAVQYTRPGTSYPIPLTPSGPEQSPNGPRGCGPGPEWFYLEPPSLLVLGPLPSLTETAPGGIQVRAVLQPILQANNLDAGLVQHGQRAITAGALSWLLTMNDEPWFNPVLAREFAAEFRALSSRAELDAASNFRPFNYTTAIYRF